MDNEEKKYKLADPVFQRIQARKKDVFFVIVSIIIGIFFEWNMVEISIFAVFVWSIIGPIASRHLAMVALFFLCFTPILLILGRKIQAEEFAIYAYYFLVMTVVRGVIEVRQEMKLGSASDK